jgi:hypothetical protein
MNAADVTEDTISATPELPGCSHGWLYAYSFDSRGTMTCSYMTTTELDERLNRLDWQISLTKSSEFEQIVQTARCASALLLSMMKDLSDCEPRTTMNAPTAGKDSFPNGTRHVIGTTKEDV